MRSHLQRTLRANRLFDLYGGLLTKRQRYVVYLYYSMDLSLGEIADRTDVTRQAVHDALARAVGALEEAEERLGFLERWERLQVLLGRLGEIAFRADDPDSEIGAILAAIEDINPLR